MAKKFIDGKTDEDWALANDANSVRSSSPPRFARVKPTTVEEPSVLINHSIAEGFPPYGDRQMSFHGQ